MDDTLIFIIMFSGIFGAAGIIFFVIGMIMLNNIKKKEQNCTSKTYGKVTDLIRHQNNNRDDGYSFSWHPVFEYNIGNLKFIKEEEYGSSKAKYAIGQNVEIYFNPEDYNEYYIAGESRPKKAAMLFIVVGIGAIMLAIVAAILKIQIH